MSTDKWLVLGIGVIAIVWVLWYFLLSRRTHATASTSTSGFQEIVVTVKGGYDPPLIEVRAGQPVRLIFDRQDTSGCSEELLIPDFRIRRFLPALQRTPVEFTPERSGEHQFTCGMGMLRGKLVVR